MLELRDVAVGRGGRVILHNVTFSVPETTCLVLRGPNGSGKTTLLRAIAGLQTPLEGDLRLHAPGVAYSGHADGVKSTLTVAENLRFWARIYQAASGIDAALTAFDLGPLRDRPAGHLSAGQRRRVGLARLCVTGCALWVLDEPTVSLDARAVGHFAQCVQRHLAGGGAAIIATHIDLGLDCETLDVSKFRPMAGKSAPAHGDEAFL